MLTKEEAHKYFEYKNGILFWKVGQKKGKITGIPVGANKSYFATKIKNTRIYNHKIIFLMHYGYVPKIIDFIDGNTFNTRIENLREATYSEAIFNSKIRKDNTSGIRGVSFDKNTNKWVAIINKEKQRFFLGSFDHIEDAAKAYQEMAKKLYGKFAKE